MSTNVWLKCGRTFNLLPATTGNTTGNWIYKDSVYTTFQAVVSGTGAVGATITIQGSNDGVNAVSTPLGTITLSGTTIVSDGFSAISSWKFVRAVVSGSSGTIASIEITMGV